MITFFTGVVSKKKIKIKIEKYEVITDDALNIHLIYYLQHVFKVHLSKIS